MNPPMAVETRRRQRRAPAGWGTFSSDKAELFVDERAQELLRLLLDPLRHRARFFGREALELVEQLELEQLLVRVFLDLRPLARDFRFVDLALGLRRQVRAGAHRQRAGQRAGESRGEHDLAAAGVAGHAGHDAEDGAEAVVDAVDRVANPAGAAHVPALAAQDRVERRSRRRNRAAGQRAQDDRVIAFLEHRFFGDLAVGRIAQPRHQLVVFGLGLVLFLFEPVEDDVRIGDALEPRQAALDFLAIRRAAGGGGDALGPARGVLLFLLGEPDAGCPCASDRARDRRGAGRSWPPRPRGATSSRRSRGSPCRCAIAQSDQPLEEHDGADAGGDQQHLAERVRVDLRRGGDRESDRTSRCTAGWPTRTRARTAGCRE